MSAVLVISSAGAALVASPADAANVSSAVFSGAGTFKAANGTVYAKSGAALTLTVNADGNTECVQIIDGSSNVIATQTASKGQALWTFSGTAYPWLTAGSGNGSFAYTVKASRSSDCTPNDKEPFTTQSASYTLDNTAPSATAGLSPAPNAAGWNKANVAITWTGSDTGGSGVKTISPATDSVTTEGTVTKTATVTDNVGNTGTGSVTVNLDKTAPTIVGSRTPAANANGWNNSPVTVSFATTDATSGIASPVSPTTLSTDGSSQSVTRSVSDNAGNSASATVGSINIDQTAPTLTGTVTTNPNANGWYNGNVTVAWTATDALSGTTNPANSVISGEGAALTASATATDKAGNSTNAQSPAVKIDRTAPVTTVTAPPAWNKTNVTLSLVASDNLSGVDTTFYQLDGGAQQAGANVTVSSEGTHTLKYWSVDKAGNTEASHSVSFGIDKTTPTIGHVQSPAANVDGWNNTDVTVTFNCSDAGSGVASCSGPQTVTTEGSGQTVTGTVTDNAGNSATDPAIVNIDKTKPVITVDALPDPNANGWYKSDVTATFTAVDALSGVKTQDKAHTFGEGADQTATGTATDAAGNSSSVTTPKVNVDETAPTITGEIVGTPNANGWFSGDVTVHWTCKDNLSGVVDCPADTVVKGEGSTLSANASVSDLAGNTATGSVTGIKIDRTAPTTTASGVPSSWVNAPVTVALEASDNLSDIDSTFYETDGATTPTKGDTVTLGTEGVHTIKYWSVDNAGNKEDAQSATVEIDLSSPTITPGQSPDPNAQGWNNTDVSVAFSCEDQTALSGLKDCTAPQTVTTEGKAQQVKGTASDNAGNSTDATATVNIDKTAPTITGAPDRDPNQAGWYKDDVTVSFDGKDGLSGIASVTGPQHLGEGYDQSVTGTATDNADNSATATVSGINVDKTPPTLSAAPTTSPNGSGWYNHDVTEAWAADDSLSGLAGEKPADSVISGEGEGQTVSATVSDLAGNKTSATSEPVKIDKTAPTTDASAPSGWVNDSVDVILIPHDALSGVDSTHYAVDGGTEQTGTTVSLTTDGTHAIDYYSVDNAGNAEKAKTIIVQIDKTAPSISHSLDPKANDNGWNNSDVTVTFTCADQPELSGIKSCTAPQTVTSEGKDQAVSGTATDNAGNSATDPATVSVDKTKPVIDGTRSPAANADGWNNTDVTVHFTASDALSGLASVTPDRTLGEGTDQSVDGTAVDAAGNSAATTVGHINVDETAPTLVGKPTTAPNDSGWYNGDVVIGWTADDDRSGVPASPADSTITGEGEGLKATATVSDRAGNSTTADSPKVNIDRTPPTTGASAPGGWSNSAVTVSLDPSDGLSGVAATYYTVDGGDQQKGTAFTINTEGVHTVTYWSVDKAGNAEKPQALELKIDLTKPTIGHSVIPAPNAQGWNNSPVTVQFSCDDALSGVATCPADQKVSTDGQDQAVPGTAVDNAGNTQTDPASVSIDTVKPTISGSPDRRPNANDWYDGDVTISYSCDDELSGIADCSPPATLGEGAAQEVTGTATDEAGNSAKATVSDLNIDETAPTLSGAPTTHPNADGWYNGDVTIGWTAADALSGLDGAAPPDSIITAEGEALTVGASVRDLAGNVTSAKSQPVKIDRTAPTTTVTGVSGWSNSEVNVSLHPSDGLSGVKATHFRLDGGDVSTGTDVTIDTEGQHTLEYWSVDNADNVEGHQSIDVKIDKTAPSISHVQAPAANAAGWNDSDVTVTFTCTDALSGIDSCTAPQHVTTDGRSQKVSGEARDHAGNTASDDTTVNVDTTKPTVSVKMSADANANGWYDGDVTATFTCADQESLSGVASCPAAKTFGEGADQSVSGTATDIAGNVSEAVGVQHVNVDETKPSLDGAPTTAPNDNGWYNDDVVVKWTASDLLSGLDGSAPGPSTITGEGDDLSTGTSVSDKAGNVQTATVKGIKIDRTAPHTTATAPSGWQNSDATVKLSASDNLSGVARTRYSVDNGQPQDGTTVSVSAEGAHQVSFWSVDKAGNAEAPQTVTVLVDKSAPTISGAPTTKPNAGGWYNSAVTVHFTCGDSVSGIASCQPDATVSAEGANQSATGTAVDNAGNKATATVGGINVDTVKPVVAVGGVKDGAVYTLGAVPTVVASATDATSGLSAPATFTRTGGLANGVGTYTVTATATDKAGNVGTATVSYTVIYGYGTTLFLQPVNDTAHQTGLATSVFNAGQTIPMKFQVRNAAGQVVQTNTAPQWLTPVKGSATSAAVNESAYAGTGTVGGSYVWDGTQYQYNWKTDKSQAGSYWRVGVTLDDGKTYNVNVALK